MAALIYEGSDIVLIGPTGELVKRIHVADTLIGAGWSPDRCHVEMMTATGPYIRLVDLDVITGTEHELFVCGEDENGNPKLSPDLSPDRKWITYVVWSGKPKPFYGAELQDVEVVAASEWTRPIRLTERGGAAIYGGTWSPDSQYLAYSDYDETGCNQLYIAHPDGSNRQQLTHFSVPDLIVDAAQWSPDGQRLAFSVTDQDDILQETWTIRVDGSESREMILDEGRSVRGSPLWWSQDSSTLIVYVWGNAPVQGLYWYRPDTGNVEHVFYDVEAPSGVISLPFSISDVERVGFVGGDFYSYSLTSGTYRLWLSSASLFPEYQDSKGGWPILRQVIPVPGGPVDTSQCSAK